MGGGPFSILTNKKEGFLLVKFMSCRAAICFRGCYLLGYYSRLLCEVCTMQIRVDAIFGYIFMT